jgi:hypothetical protein
VSAVGYFAYFRIFVGEYFPGNKQQSNEPPLVNWGLFMLDIAKEYFFCGICFAF